MLPRRLRVVAWVAVAVTKVEASLARAA